MSESTASSSPTPQADGGPNASRLGGRWLRKRWMFIIATFAIGTWGLVDAVWIYPKRGMRAAESLEYQYLETLRQEGRGTVSSVAAAVEDPVERFARLEETLGRRGTGGSPADQLLYQWLQQLDYIGRLTPAATKIPRDDFRGERVETAEERFQALRQRWATADGKPKSASPLENYDIPSQWIIMVIFYVWSAYLVVDLLSARRRTYRWDPSSRTLTLPGIEPGVRPTHLEEIDKRRWDKFYVTLRLNASHPSAGGRSFEIDLMRYEPVEDWVLVMEREAFPEPTPAAVAPGASSTPEPSAQPPQG